MEKYRRGCTISSLPFTLVTLILILLKICGVINCSWWVVFLPLAIVPAIVIVWFLLILILCLTTILIKTFL